MPLEIAIATTTTDEDEVEDTETAHGIVEGRQEIAHARQNGGLGIEKMTETEGTGNVEVAGDTTTAIVGTAVEMMIAATAEVKAQSATACPR